MNPSSVACWLLGNLALLAMASPCLRLSRGRAERIRLFLLAFIAGQTTLVLLAGTFGFLRPLPLALGALLLSLGSLWASRRLPWRFPVLPPAARLPALCLIPVLLRQFFHVWLFPPYVWDTLSYHLVNAAEWTQAGSFTVFDTPATNAFFPAGFGALLTWHLALLQHDAWVELAGLPFYGLVLCAVYTLARQVGCGTRASAWAVVLTAYTPALVQHTVSCNNDIAIAGLLLCLLSILNTRDLPSAKASFTLALPIFLLGFGIKPTLAFCLPGLLLRMLLRDRGPNPEAVRTIRLPTAIALILQLTGLLAGGYWYVRNLLYFGNPFHPVDFRMGGHLIFGTGEGVGQRGSMDIGEMTSILHALFAKRIWDGHRIYPDLADSAGWGWVAIGLGLPCALAAIRANRDLRHLLLCATASLVGIASMVGMDGTNARFFIWMPALLAVACAATLARLRPGPVKKILVGLAIIGTFLNALASLDAGRFRFLHWRLLAWAPLADRSAALATSFTGQDYAEVLTHVPPGASMAFVGGNFSNIYPLYGPDLSRKLVFRNSEPPEDLASDLRKQGLRFVYLSQREEMRSPHFHAYRQQLEETPFQRLTPGLYALDFP